MTTFRIGNGYDVHRLVTGRDCIICGVNIPSPLGLKGHSDADVALHALAEGGCAENGVGEGMQRDVGIRMSFEPER